MGESTFRGPSYVAGSMYDGRDETMDGPSLTYQADGFPDCRFWPTKKDGLYPGRVPAFLNSPYVVMTDNIPQASGTASLAALQTIAAANTAFTLSAGATAQANGSTAGNPTMAPGCPLVPIVVGANGSMQWAGSAVSVIALDFGFTTGTTTTGGTSTTITVPDSSLFYPGQWIYVGGAGNSGKTAPLLTQVLTLASTTTITVSVGASSAVTNAPIGSANLPGPLPQAFGGGSPQYQPNSVMPYLNMGGLGNFLNPPETVTRCVSVTGVSGGTGGSGSQILVSGYDIFGMPMSQLMNGPVGATSVYTTKAFKYITSIKSGAAWADTSHNYSVGISDVYGFALRSDKWEYTQINWNNAFNTSSTGWTAGVKTNPATQATGDVRGTIQTNTNSGPGTGIGSTASNGSTVRLFIAMTVPLYNDLYGNPQNPASMFGVNQV